MTPVISVEQISKSYRLGVISSGTFADDLKIWWARARGKANPLLRIGEADHANRVGEEIWALRDISFTVEQGEALGIIGRNGAGKSTLLKILSRVTAPTSGLIKVKGRIASLLEVGTGFHPDLTGRENISLNGAIMGMTKEEVSRKFDEIVDFSGVEQFIDTPVKRYSSGMYVRLAFAVAAHLDPEILVVDEVLAVGDAEFQKKCLGKMGDVAKEGRTVLFVSHNMLAVQSLCNRGICLKNGEINAEGDIRETIAHYLSKGTNFYTGMDLINHPGRHPGSKAVIRKLHIKKDNAEILYLPIGQPIEFEIWLSPGSEVYKNSVIGFGIYDMYGQLVLQCKTNIQYPHTWMLDQEKKVKLFWDECLLAPGLYKIGISFSSDGNVVDWVDDIVEVESRLEEDYYRTGRSGFLSRGFLFPKVRWSILDAEDH